MKKITMFLMFSLLLVAATFAQADSTVTVATLNALPGAEALWTEWASWIIGTLLFLWEIITRLVPTASNWTLSGKIVWILDFLAKLFNGIGNVAKRPDGGKAAFKQVVK